jgi:pantoate--beta-alanine ligase
VTASPSLSGLRVVQTRAELALALHDLRRERRTLAFVPTMGYLHEGHLTLIDRGRALADSVVLSIFVNPLQFGPQEDLDRYPRSLERDLALAEARGAALAFVPSVEEMYPEGPPRVRVHPGAAGDRLCGASRPGHFEGVLTVVARLFGLIRPEVAIFGRKDAQQAALIRRMVRDLELGVAVDVAPLVRETDGLALSSRNAYLTPEERAVAPRLQAALEAGDAAFRRGVREPASLVAEVRRSLADTPAFRFEYAEVVEMETLETPSAACAGHLLLVAAHLGPTRLIDNRVLGEAGLDLWLPSEPSGSEPL